MGDPTCSGTPADVPAPELATCDGLPAEHARLRSRGVHQRAGGWVVARPEDVTEALTSPALSVAVPASTVSPPAGDAARLQARMARFSDGIEHARRRVLLEQLLPESTPLETAARRWVAAAAQRGPETWDVMPLARAVPVLVLAEALGVPAGQLRRVGDLVGRLCDALAPSLGVPGCEPGGDEAARQLPPLLADIGPWSAELTVAVVGLLFQARDATAALIGAAMLTGASATDTESGTAASVEVALREAAPVQCTRRTSVEDLSLGGATVPAGAPVWVILAAAEQGMPHPPATFGAGPHACPGADHAVALARGVLAGLAAAGWRPVPEQPVRYEARPNLRMPAAVLVYRP